MTIEEKNLIMQSFIRNLDMEFDKEKNLNRNAVTGIATGVISKHLDKYVQACKKDKMPDFFCGHQVHGFKRCESQCDYCKDKPKIQKA